MILRKNIRLRAIEKEDLPRFVTWLNDTEVIEHLLYQTPMSLGQEERWYQNILQKPVEEQPLVIEALEGSQWIPLGNLGLFDFNWHEHSAEVGIFIGEKSHWSKGFGSAALRLMVHHAFFDLGLNRVYLHVDETNPRAIKSYEKAGFSPEGRLRQAHWEHGKFIDVLLMSILRSDWKEEN